MRRRPAWGVLWLAALLVFGFQLDSCVSPYAVAPGVAAARVVVPDDDDDDDSGEPHASQSPRKDHAPGVGGHGWRGRLLGFGGLVMDLIRSGLRTPRLRATAWPEPHTGPMRRPARDRNDLQAESAGAALLTLLGVSLT